jgi:predicted dehydrogenase
MNQIGVAIVGTGGITLQNHLPGLALCPGVAVTALCDADANTLAKAKERCPGAATFSDYKEAVTRADVQAVIIATPNFLHAPIAHAAIAAGKHVLCEKPIALNYPEARGMYLAAEKAGVRHMTAFTYRFVPAMRYMRHLVKSGEVGAPWHFRSCRLQDWGTRSVGWRQVAKLAGSGELGDMLSHRLDYAHSMLGPMTRLTAHTQRIHDVRGGQVNDLEDWVVVIGDYTNGAVGVLESSKMATGRGEGAFSQDYVEINGSEGSIVFQLEQPLQLQITKKGESKLRTVPVPKEFLKVPGSPRDPSQGDPVFTFRYDQNFEFIDAIRNNRPCSPSFYDGALAQGVMDAALTAAKDRRWVDVSNLPAELKA